MSHENERVKTMHIKLGIFCYGEYYSKESTSEGHIEIAKRIINNKPSWRAQFESETRWKDPVDFLIYRKGAIKIGNRWGARKISYSSLMLDKETEGVLIEYQSAGWEVEDVYVLNVLNFRS